MRLGILGGGQLGRMLAMSAAEMGIRCRCMDHSGSAVAGHVCELVVDKLEDPRRLPEFLDEVDVVTYEFENVPVELTQRIAALGVPVYPPPGALKTAQDRWLEKSLFASLSIGAPPFRAVNSLNELKAAVEAVGFPAVAKTRRFGYDGKGQVIIRAAADIKPAWSLLQRGVPDSASSNLGPVPLLVEGFVKFDRELSVLVVRGREGDMVTYPLVHNEHRDGILRVSLAPAPDLSDAVANAGEAIGRRVADAMNYVGVLAVELFQVGETLLANEIAPRVHNSGHWTMEGAATSQFANHVRAVMGLPLGSCAAPRPAAMVNLIGEHPPLNTLLRVAGSSVHLYGKAPRPGRKLGHMNVVSASASARAASVAQIRAVIGEAR